MRSRILRPFGVETVRALTTPGVRACKLIVDGEAAIGWIGVPETGTSDRLLVIAKGWMNEAYWFAEWLEELAGNGILAVVMEYRGPAAAFKVRSGAEDTVAATLALHALHPVIDLTVLYGYSMGGEISGVAVAEAPPGTYDYWVNGVAVMDLAALWTAQPVAREAIEAETGGTPSEVPAAYRWRSPLDRVPEITRHGLARAYLVYGAADVLVPLDHAERMYEALVEAGVPGTYYVAVTQGEGCVWVPLVVACPAVIPAGSGSHEAGYSGVANEIVDERLERKQETSERAIRMLYEALTGTRLRI